VDMFNGLSDVTYTPIIIIIIKNECHSNIIVDRLQGCKAPIFATRFSKIVTQNLLVLRDIQVYSSIIDVLFLLRSVLYLTGVGVVWHSCCISWL